MVVCLGCGVALAENFKKEVIPLKKGNIRTLGNILLHNINLQHKLNVE
jgi:hypothetical protein